MGSTFATRFEMLAPVNATAQHYGIPAPCSMMFQECFMRIAQRDVNSALNLVRQLVACRDARPDIPCAGACARATGYALDDIDAF